MNAKRSGALAMALCGLLTACSDRSTTPTPDTNVAAEPPKVVAVAKPKPVYRLACELVTQDDMSRILGSAVVAEAGPHSANQSTCLYKPANGNFPYVDLSVDRGEGEAGMQGASFAASAQPGVANPYAGLGDQATAAGPAVMIRTGDDLVTIMVMGVKDRKGVLKAIFDQTKAGM